MCKGTWTELREEHGKTISVLRSGQEPSKCRKPVPQVTMEEVAKHNSLTDMWIVVESRVYDVTKWFKSHPGGYGPLLGMAGKDATDMFSNFHPNYVWEKKLPYFHCADVVDKPAESEEQKDFRELRQGLLRDGLFETRVLGFYGPMIVMYALLLGAAVYFTSQADSTAGRMFGAVLLGLYFQQLAFIGHDLGHNAVTHDRKKDLWIGQLLTAVFGVSIAWWKRSHNTHHVCTNSIEQDPDIQHLPVIALDSQMFKGFFSTYHSKIFRPLVLDPLARFFVCNQHRLYYPIMALARVNLYIQSIKMVFVPFGEAVELRTIQMAALVFFFSSLAFISSFCSSIAEAVAYILVAHAVSGLLHVQITISHFAMDIYSTQTDAKYVSPEGSWLRTQLATTMNVDCSPMLDWLHGGLQFQIEHHLFPRVPRHNLREVRRRLKGLCKKHDLPYHEYSFWNANKMVIEQLRKASMAAQTLASDSDAVAHAKATLSKMSDEAIVG